jgi:two-component system chemotaxis response regulator CheB
MISSLTEEGADATLEAIELGAVDFVAKPGGAISLEIDRLRSLLVEKVRAAASARIPTTHRLTERIRHQFRGVGVASKSASTSPRKATDARLDAAPGLVLVGTSTGGPAALDVVLPALPPGFPWPVMVAQHMPASFTGPFAKRLNRICELEVVEVSRPMLLRAGTVYIGRGDADLIVAHRSSGLNAMSVPAQRDYPWHPSVERMVTSAMEHYDASRLIGVLMTGMGRDGADAMTELHQQGGWTIAEAESTAVVYGMPRELVKNGGADAVRPLEDIAAAIVEWMDADALR